MPIRYKVCHIGKVIHEYEDKVMPLNWVFGNLKMKSILKNLAKVLEELEEAYIIQHSSSYL